MTLSLSTMRAQQKRFFAGMHMFRLRGSCTGAYQIKPHRGYAPDEGDFRDMRALRDRFGYAAATAVRTRRGAAVTAHALRL